MGSADGKKLVAYFCSTTDRANTLYRQDPAQSTTTCKGLANCDPHSIHPGPHTDPSLRHESSHEVVALLSEYGI